MLASPTLVAARTTPDLSYVETPAAWNYAVEYPSRSECATNEGLTFEVGDGKAYATPRAVPWEKLLPCDTVLIYYRSTPYTDIVFMGTRGQKNKVITVRGVPGPNGERPVFDANNATSPPTSTGYHAGLTGLGMFVISPPVYLTGAVYGYKPGHIHITGLTIRNARSPSQFKDINGTVTSWNWASGIYALAVQNLSVTNSELSGSGNGLFVNSKLDFQVGTSGVQSPYPGDTFQSRRLLVRGNYFHDNGVAGSASLHNAYTETVGAVYEYNYFGRPIAGSLGDNIKERSAGVVFRHNYISGGVDNISLRDPQSNGAYEAVQKDSLGEDLVKYAFVYNNFFLHDSPEELQGIVAHGDGDWAGTNQIRYGKLFFYNNRVVTQYDGPAPLFQLLNHTKGVTTAVALNNLLYSTTSTGATSGTDGLALYWWGGLASFSTFTNTANATINSNWINAYSYTMPNAAGYSSSIANPNLYVGPAFDGTGLNGMLKQNSDPGFVNAAGKDFRLNSTSVFYTLKATLPAEATARNLTLSGQEPVMSPFTGPALP